MSNQKHIESNSTSTLKPNLFSIDWASDKVYKTIKIIIPAIFIVLIVCMSYSRLSNINTSETPDYCGFCIDLGIVSLILLIIYLVFMRHYDKLFYGYRNINKQLSDFKEVFISNKVFISEADKENTSKEKFDNFKNNYDSILNSIKGNLTTGVKGIEHIGSLWWEFCETLIVIRKKDNDLMYPCEYHENNPVETLKNTDQIEVYINSENIIDKQLSREIFDVIPGILTGIGLIGTFLAITIALISFNIDTINLSIQNLLGGLSIKFISSLAGIGTSIIFLFIKCKLFSELEKNISHIQLKLNSIFPRITSETYLYHILDKIKYANERLEDLEDYAENQKNLADGFIANMSAKIKEVLENSVQKDIKEVLDSLNESLSKSISSNLEAPLKKLVEVMEDVKNTKEESSTKAITDVLEKIFNKDSFKHASSSMAEGITEGIDASVSRMNEQGEKIGDLVQQISGYVTQLHNYGASVEEHYKNLLENLSKALSTQTDFVDKNHEYVNALAEASNKISATSSNLDIVSDRFNEATEGFSQAVGNVTTIVDTSETIVNNTADLNNNLERVFEKFKEKAQNSIEGVFNEFGANISEICAKIQTAIGGLEEVDFDELKDSIETLSEVLKEKQGL